MKNTPILLLFLFVSFFSQMLSADPESFPYEWSGQFGHLSDQGQVIWNQDWMSGPLVLDGSWMHFPHRYGPGLFNQRAKYKRTIPKEESFPDSLVIQNYFDYVRGDYLFDQLEADAVFANETRKIRLNGFKRTFAGVYNQYANPTDISQSPNQQTYRIDYQSKTESEYVNASAAMVVTHAGVPDTLGSAVHQDHILTAGLHWKTRLLSQVLDIHVSSFSQKMTTSFSLNKTRIYLQHPYLNIRLSRPEPEWFTGLGVKGQGRNTYDQLNSIKKTLFWFNGYLYGQFKRLEWKIGPGFALNSNLFFWHGNMELDLSKNHWINTLSYDQDIQTQHPSYGGQISSEDLKDYWMHRKASADFIREFNSGRLESNLRWSALDISETNELMDSYSASIGTGWTIWRGWEIDGNLSFRYKLNELTDGAKNKVSASFTAHELLFNRNMDASVNLSVNGWLNRQGSAAIHPVYGAPHSIEDGSALPDIWLTNLEVKAVISSMTITWTVHNLLNTTESGVRQIYGDVEQDLFWLNTTPFFVYPEGRLITFGVYWTFDN